MQECTAKARGVLPPALLAEAAAAGIAAATPMQSPVVRLSFGLSRYAHIVGMNVAKRKASLGQPVSVSLCIFFPRLKASTIELPMTSSLRHQSLKSGT